MLYLHKYSLKLCTCILFNYMFLNFHVDLMPRVTGNENFKLLIIVEQSVHVHAHVHTHTDTYSKMKGLMTTWIGATPLVIYLLMKFPQFQQETDLHTFHQKSILQWITHISKCIPHGVTTQKTTVNIFTIEAPNLLHNDSVFEKIYKCDFNII
jgi:hypothetical protein